ncbi:MAG: hypothetical protein ACK4K3_07445 [Aquabacterium sp.]
MTTTSLTTELEAVNTILESIDEPPVSSLALTGLYPLEKVKGILNEVSRVIQSKGWAFNTEREVEVALAPDGTATLPANCLYFDADPDFPVIARGLRLYDTKKRSYVLDRAPKGTAVFLLPWDELPQAARHYITLRSCRTAQGRSSISESTYRYTEQDVVAAEQALGETESSTGDYNMLTDSWSVASVLQGRELIP